MNDRVPTKILFTTLFPSLRAGGQISLLLLLERLNRERFSPVVVVPAEGEVAEKAREIGCDVRIFPFPPLRSGLAVLRAILRLRQLLKIERISLIHTDDPRSTFYAMAARVGLGVPLLWQIRTEGRDVLDPLLERGADRLILVAEALGQRFSPRARDRAVVIHNGVTSDRVPPMDPASLPPWRSPLVICPARLDPSKGQRLLIEAVPVLTKEFPSIMIWFIGEGPYRVSLAKRAEELGVAKSIHFLGFRRDLRSLFPLADLVVLPSLPGYEAFPRVVLEAMAAGKAVVATRVAGLAEMIQDGVTGLLVAPNDVSALAEATGRILRDRDFLNALEAAARVRARRFTMERTVSLTEALYRETLYGNASRRF